MALALEKRADEVRVAEQDTDEGWIYEFATERTFVTACMVKAQPS